MRKLLSLPLGQPLVQIFIGLSEMFWTPIRSSLLNKLLQIRRFNIRFLSAVGPVSLSIGGRELFAETDCGEGTERGAQTERLGCSSRCKNHRCSWYEYSLPLLSLSLSLMFIVGTLLEGLCIDCFAP